MGLCSDRTGGAVVAHEAAGKGDGEGFVSTAASQFALFEDLLEGNADAEVFSYAIPVVVR